jgi:carboxymethylenebutenolidase
MDIERSLLSFFVNGHEVGVESFRPVPSPTPLPLVILLHGRDGPDGVAGDCTYHALGRAVALGGYRVLLPRYFERTQGGEPDPGYESLDRIGWEVEKYGLWLEALGTVIRASREAHQPLGLLGYSLGGYLALSAAMAWREIAAVAVCYSGFPTPFASLAAQLPPTLVLHGAEDLVIPVKEALALTGILRSHRVLHGVHIYPHAGHGFCGVDAEDAITRVVRFFSMHLSNREGPVNYSQKVPD